MSSNSINHPFFNGVGTSGMFTTALPSQVVSASKKKSKGFIRATLDRLEQIAESQLRRNIELVDYYKMIRGEIVYSDYGLPDLTKEIVRLREEMDFPVHARHYDFLGIIVNQLKGEALEEKAKFRVDNTDPISQNEFVRTRTDEFRSYVQQLFEIELQQKLFQRGIVLDPNMQFESEEEQQQYLQFIEEQKNNIIPLDVREQQIAKNWKTQAAEWAEKTLEYDTERFTMDEMYLQEVEDFILTGKWFRHYHIGYDYYKPERWHPAQVFISEDIEAKYPQNGEYVGRIHWMSPSDIVNRWGHKISANVQKRLLGFFNETDDHSVSGGNQSLDALVRQPHQIHHVPFEGWYDYDLTLQFQEIFDTPFGQTTITEDGQQKKVPAWFSPLNRGQNFLNNEYARMLRSDIEIRNDLLQTTEAYWRSFKKIGTLNFVNDEGLLDSAVVTEDILGDFLKEYEIQTLNEISLEEAERNPKPNTITWTYVPEIRWGVKVRAGNSYLLEDLYIGGEPLEFQIKGNSNIYDVQLPVVGFIGDSIAKKLRPFIIKYNIVLNQVYSFLEKELGTFFLFDVHYLPAEYKSGSVRESLEEMYELIQELSIVPVDTSKQNMQGNQPAMNAFMTQTLDFTNQISNRLALAKAFKQEALELIGLTPQRIGAPNKYSTAEGIKQGAEASYAQTQSFFTSLAASNKEANLTHLAVAQYCQKEYKDFSFFYTKSDGEKVFIELSDPYFQARQWGLIMTNNPNERKALESVRAALLNNNTMGADTELLASVMLENSLPALVEIGRRQRLKAEQQQQQAMAHEQELLDKELAYKAEKDELEKAIEVDEADKDRENRLEVARIAALGRAADKDSDAKGIAEINKATQDAINNGFKEREVAAKEMTAEANNELAKKKVETDLANVNLRLEEIKLRRERIQADKYIATVNKN